MKRSYRLFNISLVVSLVAVGALAWAGTAHAAELIWDANGIAPPYGGTGTWNTADPNWYNSATPGYQAWANGNNDIAVFGGKSGTATLGEPITVGGITFNDSAGYVITGDTLTFGVAGAITANVDATIESNLAGGAITKAGDGKLTLTGANTYTGQTTISGGTLSFSSAANLPTTSGIVFRGGTLEYTGSASVGTYNLSGGSFNVNVTDSAGNITITRPNQNYEPLYKGGAGTITLDAVDYQDSGDLRVDQGAAVLNGRTRWDCGFAVVGSIIDVVPGATVKLSNSIPGQVFWSMAMSGGTFDVNGQDSGNTASVTAIGGTGTITNSSTSPGMVVAYVRGYVRGDVGFEGKINFEGNIVDGLGTVGVTLANPVGYQDTGDHTWTLSGNNTYSGATNVANRGTLRAGSTTAFSPNSAYTVAGGRTLDANSLNNSIGSLTGSGNVTLGAATLTIGSDNTSPAVFSGPISGTGGAIVKVGTGTLTLSGTNTYDGGTSVNEGAVIFRSTAAMPASGTTAVAAGATLGLGVGGGGYSSATDVDNLFAGNFVDALANVTFTETSIVGIDTTAGSFVYASSIASTAKGLTKFGGNILTLGGGNAYTGLTTIAGGVLSLDHANALGGGGGITFTGGTLQYTGNNAADYSDRIINSTGAIAIDTNGQNVDFASALSSSNTGGLAKVGAGTMTLSGDNAYTGGTILGAANAADAGSLLLSGSGTLGGAGPLTVYAGTLDLNGITQSITTLALGGGSGGSTATIGIGAGDLKLGGDVTFTSANNPNGATISGDGGGKLSLLGDRTFTVGDSTAAADDLTVSAVIQDGDLTARALTKAGAGTLVLSGANTYTGATNLNAGVLNASANANLGSEAGTIAPLTFGGGTLQFASAFDPSVRTVTINAGGATIDTRANTVTFANAIGNGGAGGLTKIGSGALVLNGAPNYTGATTVSEGVLTANAGALAAANVSGGQLNLNANVTGTLKLTSGSVVVGSGAAVGTADLVGTGTVDATNPLTINNVVKLNLSGNALTLTGSGPSFALSGADLNNPTAVNHRTLAVSGGTLTMDLLAYPTAGLVGRWTFDDGTADDSSGNSYNGTGVNSPTYSSTDVGVGGGQSLVLNGSNLVYVDTGGAGNQTVFDGGTAMTISAWVKGWPGSNWNPYIAKRGEGGVGWQERRGGNNDNLSWTTRGAGDDYQLGKSTTGDGNWHMLTTTFDSTIGANQKKVYMDGTLLGQQTVGGTITVTQAMLSFGARATNNAYSTTDWQAFFNGKLDDIYFYNRAVNADEVGQLYAYVPVSSLDLSTTNIVATENTTLVLPTIKTTLGNLTLRGGTLSIGTPVVPANLTMAEDFTYDWAFDGTSADKVDITGSLTLTAGWDLVLTNIGSGTPVFGSRYELFTYTSFSGSAVADIIASPADWPAAWTFDDPTAKAIYLQFGVLGDADGNGIVDAADYIRLKQYFGQFTANYTNGDFDGDNDVDWDDLQILMAQFSTRSIGEAPAAPEPGSVMLLMFGAAALLRRRRKA